MSTVGAAIDVIAIFGPTASGKTAVAERVADSLGTEVVSADALQVYRGLEILTAQPTRPTRLVGIRDLSETMSVGEYAALAHDAIDELVEEKGKVVVAGGTGLYLRAALADLRLPPSPSDAARAAAEAAVATDRAAAYEHLRALDPRAAALVHPHDTKRLVRALELAEAGASLAPESDRLWAGPTRRPTLMIGLDVPPDALAARIRARAEAMFAAGVVDEVVAALEAGPSQTAEQALGLREIAELPREDALERIAVRTRRYAAYQRKWMRRIPDIVLVDADREPDLVGMDVLRLARRRGAEPWISSSRVSA